MESSFKWGKIPLEKDSKYELKIYGLNLQIDCYNDVLAFKLAPKNENIEDAPVNRVVGKVQELSILPALPDRPFILKPKTILSILPETTFKFYVYLPVTFQIYSGAVKAENKVFENPVLDLSSTWFGEPHDGELCYALYTSFDVAINENKKGNEFVICPVEITNNSKEKLDVKRLAVRGIHLNIYANSDLMISNTVMINYDGFDSVTNVQFSKGVTVEIPNLIQIAAARIPENNKILKRSFQLIRHITQF